MIFKAAIGTRGAGGRFIGRHFVFVAHGQRYVIDRVSLRAVAGPFRTTARADDVCWRLNREERP